jgi:hypothetical protein
MRRVQCPAGSAPEGSPVGRLHVNGRPPEQLSQPQWTKTPVRRHVADA